jgi:hypothetical protein
MLKPDYVTGTSIEPASKRLYRPDFATFKINNFPPSGLFLKHEPCFASVSIQQQGCYTITPVALTPGGQQNIQKVSHNTKTKEKQEANAAK